MVLAFTSFNDVWGMAFCLRSPDGFADAAQHEDPHQACLSVL
ncbi:hypothetical protein [Lonsdalea britannica]|nr:hypothetical protein [Lonsdalea britannica]